MATRGNVIPSTNKEVNRHWNPYPCRHSYSCSLTALEIKGYTLTIRLPPFSDHQNLHCTHRTCTPLKLVAYKIQNIQIFLLLD